MKFPVRYGSVAWARLFKKHNPGWTMLGIHDAMVVLKSPEGRIFKAIGGSPQHPTVRIVNANEDLKKLRSRWQRPLRSQRPDLFQTGAQAGHWFFWMGRPRGIYRTYGPKYLPFMEAWHINQKLQMDYAPMYRMRYDYGQKNWIYEPDLTGITLVRRSHEGQRMASL